jgi:hypothetical protein
MCRERLRFSLGGLSGSPLINGFLGLVCFILGDIPFVLFKQKCHAFSFLFMEFPSCFASDGSSSVSFDGSGFIDRVLGLKLGR